MTIEKYQQLTGITVPQSQIPEVKAQITRVRIMLETALGYSLNKQAAYTNYYFEKGKSDRDCFFGTPEDESLNDPDEVVTAYRLYPYNKNDKYFTVDPFTTLNAVKLVYVREGATPNGITIRTFEQDEVRVIQQKGINKYIQRCESCFCLCECDDCVMLAVDAEWLFEDCLPEDLLYIWADGVTYQTDCKRDIKRETLGTHTYEKFDRGNPLESSTTITILKKYAGLNGSLHHDITI
jgi:hypothetical protein